MKILGIDPGAKGALAFFDVDAGILDVIDTPAVQVKRGQKLKLEISPQMTASVIAARKPTVAVMERTGAMPGQGVSSMYQFGRSCGMLEGILAALQVPVTYVSPATWQKDVNARAGKDGNRARAAELYPAYAAEFARKKDDGRADAALMAWWMATR